MRQRQKPDRSIPFLEFSKQQSGLCCICSNVEFEELHHYGSDAGLSMKGNDYEVCRVCMKCHSKHQGWRWLSFHREGKLDILANMQRDTINLLKKWINHIDGK